MKIHSITKSFLPITALCVAALTFFSTPVQASASKDGSDSTDVAAESTVPEADSSGFTVSEADGSEFFASETDSSGFFVSDASESDPAGSERTSADSSLPSVPPTLWVVGDSTAAEFDDTTYYYPRYGWGTQLFRYFPGISVVNLAVSGTSTLSFSQTAQYQRLLREMKTGDYLLIGFGHNDEKPETARYTNPNTSITTPGSIQYYLYEYYIRPAQEAGVNPILCTPIVRRDPGNNYTGASGHITAPQTTIDGTFEGGDYAKAIRRTGVAKSVPVLDLTRRTRDIYTRLGAQGVKDRHARSSLREASIDNTHTSLYGAACNAWLIADELSRSSSTLKNYLAETVAEPDPSILTVNPLYQERAFRRPDGESARWPTIKGWKGTVFGDIDAYEYLNDVYFTLSPYADEMVWMRAGRFLENDSSAAEARVGKISATTDGIAMYYQAIPSDRNFTLSADVTIYRLDPNNQASFGLMVRDDIYLDTVTSDTLGDYVAAGPLMLGSDAPWNCFARKSGVLTQGGDTSRIYRPGEIVHIEIRKTSDGYTCTFGDNPPVSAGFDFPLTAIDSEYVYAGMFVARSADVTFWNVNLELQ